MIGKEEVYLVDGKKNGHMKRLTKQETKPSLKQLLTFSDMQEMLLLLLLLGYENVRVSNLIKNLWQYSFCVDTFTKNHHMEVISVF